METQRPEPHRRTRGIGPKSSIQASCSAQWLKITKARRTLAMQSAHTLFTSSIGVVWLQQILCRHTISKEHMNIVYIYIFFFIKQLKIEFSNTWGVSNQNTTLFEHVWQSNEAKKSLPESSHLQWHEELRTKMCLYPSLLIKALKMLKCIF